MTHLLFGTGSGGSAFPVDETRSTMQHYSVGSVTSSQQSRALYDPHTGQLIH
jgi:hypothetical protein